MATRKTASNVPNPKKKAPAPRAASTAASGWGGRRAGAGRKPDPADMQQLRRQKLQLQVRDLEIDVAEKERRKLDTDAVVAAVAADYAACKARLLALPSALAPALATLDNPEQVRRVLADTIEEALRELCADDLAR